MRLPRSLQIPFVLFLIGFFTLFCQYHYRWFGEGGRDVSRIIRSDGLGYYAYLPSLFIDHDFGKQETDLLYHVKDEQGKRVNKYTYGTALLESPFFFGACAYAKLTGYPVDGYSAPFQIFISLSAVFYFLAGLFFLSRILLSEFRLTEKQVAFLLLTMALATTLFYYIVYLPSFSHVYSFFLINFFLYTVISFRDKPGTRLLVVLAILLGLIFVTRPVNVLIVLFVPFFFRDGKQFYQFLKTELFSNYRFLFLTGGVILPVLVQSYLWYLQCGKFFYWSYKGEGFYFNQPHLFDFLFSYKKGLFVYCPLLFLIFPAAFHYLRNDRWKLITSLFFFFILVYILSCWYCWYYADSYGMRPMMDFFGVFGIWIAAFFTTRKTIAGKFFLSFFMLLFIPVNLIFAYQHCFLIMHPNAMNSEKFWTIFLKTDSKYREIFGGMDDGAPYAPNGFYSWQPSRNTFNDLPEGVLNMEGNEFPYHLDVLAEGKLCAAEKIFITVRYKKKIDQPTAGSQTLFTVNVLDSDNESKYYLAFKIKELPEEPVNEWKEEKQNIFFANPMKCGDRIALGFWNRGKEKVLIDDLEIEILFPKE